MKNHFNKFFGFTLAELMVVLAVLGVIAAVLVPAVFTSMPDENRLKFKKGYYTLKRTIDIMVNSKAYNETAGNFGKPEKLAAGESSPYAKMIEEADTDGSRYFCYQFSENLNSIQTQCENFINLNGQGLVTAYFDARDISPATAPSEEAAAANTIDGKCSKFLADDEGLKYVNVQTQDGIYWSVPDETFCARQTAEPDPADPDAETPSPDKQLDVINGYSTIPAYYAVICMDVDGVGGEKPFGFGIRRDGKVVAGTRAKEWLKESVKKVTPDEDDM